MIKKRIFRRWSPGNILVIRLKDNYYSFALLLEFPLILFYNFRVREIPKIEEIITKPVAFIIWVMKSAVLRDWEYLGKIKYNKDSYQIPEFAKFDVISKRYFIHSSDGKDIPATFEEVKDLPVAAVWESSHVEDRLNDFYDNVPNKWVELIKLKLMNKN